MIEIVLTFICLSILILIRNEVVYRARGKAIDVAYAKSLPIPYNEDWEEPFRQYREYGSYEKMLFSLTKWQYKDFYPNWENNHETTKDNDDGAA